MFPLRLLPSLSVLLLSATLAACSSDSDGQRQGADCADDLDFFRTQVWAPTLGAQCIACHNAGGAASGTRMVLQPAEAPGALEANYATVRALAGEQFEGLPLLLLKPSGQHPGGHGGGKVLLQGSVRYEDLRRFVDRINHVPGACEAPAEACTQGLEAAGQRRLRLLTRFEYDNTLRDLLYLDATWGKEFPAEEVVHGFDNNAEARTVGPLLADQLLTAAEEAAALAVANLGRFVTCDAGEACARQFVTRFGERAFRRPVTGTEHGRYMTLYKAVAATEGYTAGIQTVMAAMLQSPNFLYRAELGRHTGNGQFALTDHEVASQLSYLFWGSMPDEALFAKARAGQLHTPEQVEAEARRLLASARSRPVLDHFVTQWLELDRLAQAEKDPAAFPDFTPTVRAAMRAETTELFAYVVRQGSGRLPELFSSNYSFLTSELASFYGLSGQAENSATTGMQRWALQSTGRGGILTHGSILASQATPQASSPVRRGKLVRERLLCQPLAPPPSGVEVQLPPVAPQASNRERYSEHSQNAACASCHHLMDPIGFGFEQFDSVGRYVPTQAGQPVDASGQVLDSFSTDGAFFGVDGLQEMLAESPDVHGCFSRQWMRFAYGVAEEDASCESRTLAERFQTGGLSVPELLMALTQLPAFTGRTGDVSSVSEPLPGSPSAEPLLVQVRPQSSWESGFCDNIDITNTGSRELEWVVPLRIPGTLKDAWNATATPRGEEVLFTGVSYNRKIAPGATLSFGYCAAR
jgi:hypothetical protein